MKNKSCTSDICCSGAKIIRIPRGRQRQAPKMDRVLPEVGDVILYNEKLSEGMRIRGHLNLEKTRLHTYYDCHGFTCIWRGRKDCIGKEY